MLLSKNRKGNRENEIVMGFGQIAELIECAVKQTFARQLPRTNGTDGFFRLIIQPRITAGIYERQDPVELMRLEHLISEKGVFERYIEQDQRDDRHNDDQYCLDELPVKTRNEQLDAEDRYQYQTGGKCGLFLYQDQRDGGYTA